MKLLSTKGKVIQGKLTTESNHEQPMLVVDGRPYGPGNIGIFGLYRASQAEREKLKKYGYNFFFDTETLFPGEPINELRKRMSRAARTVGWKAKVFWEDVVTENVEHTPILVEFMEVTLLVQNRGNPQKQARIKELFKEFRSVLGIQKPKGL